MTTRRAVLYGRVSKLAAGTTEGKSVDQQLAELRAIAEHEQVDIVAEHRDDGISASRYAKAKGRAGWKGVVAAINDGTCTELWVWEISRATRDRQVWATLVTACLAMDVKITVCGRVHDPADPDDGFMLDLTAALAVRESAVTSKRIKRNVRAAALDGQVHGKIAYGYRRIYNPLTRALDRQEADPEQAAVVAEIFQRVADGDTGYSIADDLNTRWVPSPHQARSERLGHAIEAPYPWTLEQVHRIASNPTYAGLRAHDELSAPKKLTRTIVAVGKWDGIVTRELYDQVQLTLSLNPTRGKPRDSTAKHLLTGIAECGVCGATCRLLKNRGYPSYSCWGTPQKRGKFCVARVQPPVDDYVTESILKRLSKADAALLFQPEDRQDDITAARIELARLEERLEEYKRAAEDTELIRAGTALSGEALARQERILTPLIAAARARTVPRGIPALIQQGLDAADKWVWWYGDPEDSEDEGLPLGDRRSVIRHLVTVTIQKSPYKHGVRGFHPHLIDIDWWVDRR